jgi:hypothetical protein
MELAQRGTHSNAKGTSRPQSWTAWKWRLPVQVTPSKGMEIPPFSQARIGPASNRKNFMLLPRGPIPLRGRGSPLPSAGDSIFNGPGQDRVHLKPARRVEDYLSRDVSGRQLAIRSARPARRTAAGPDHPERSDAAKCGVGEMGCQLSAGPDLALALALALARTRDTSLAEQEEATREGRL